MAVSIENLPPDLWALIFQKLKVPHQLAVRAVATHWRNIIDEILQHMPPRRVIKIAAGDWHTVFCYEDGSVFTCGRGEYGRLGHGNEKNCLLPTQITPGCFGGRRVVEIAAGDEHTLILCEDGSVFTFGRGRKGQLGHGNEKNCLLPKQIKPDHFKGRRVVGIAAGGYHAVFLCDDGNVFTCGGGQLGRLGHGNENDCLLPKQIIPDCFGGRRVVGIAASNFHTVFLCDDGNVFTCGWGLEGSLGHDNEKNCLLPKQIKPDHFKGRRVVGIAVGSGRTVCFCEDGNVFAFGGGGLLGLGDEYKSRLLPKQITPDYFGGRRVVGIAVGANHTVFLCKDSSTFTCGKGSFGQLGHGHEEENCLLPKQIKPDHFKGRRIVGIAAGDRHTIILCEDGSTFTCGWDKFGGLGQGNGKNCFEPTLVAAFYNPFREATHLRNLFLKQADTLETINPTLKHQIKEILENRRFYLAIPKALDEVIRIIASYDSGNKEIVETVQVQSLFSPLFQAARAALQAIPFYYGSNKDTLETAMQLRPPFSPLFKAARKALSQIEAQIDKNTTPKPSSLKMENRIE